MIKVEHMDVYALKDIVLDDRARNGTWCAMPYPGHRKGCPNFPYCPVQRVSFRDFGDRYVWYAVVKLFNLKAHAEMMKTKHPDWSERQCRNPLYWQGSVRAELLRLTKTFAAQFEGSLILDIPEAYGIDMFATMPKVGIILKKNPDMVRKIMMVGVPK
jgi:hypothetical protein